MMQKGGSNYSWWWASHIRTRQSKWLEQNHQDMEEKVKTMLKLIEEDGDSFAKRAEMYYRKRPELINFVEEFYRGYRALAERYDHISGELHSANNTIATVFPDQVNFQIDVDDGDSLKVPSKIDPSKFYNGLPESPQPKSLKNSAEILKSPKKLLERTSSAQMSRDTEEEMEKIEKNILVLQAEREIIKNSYEAGLAKFWEIEKQIEDWKEKACCLHDGFDLGSSMKEDKAEALMVATTLKSCGETLVRLQEQQQRSEEELRVESNRIKDAEKKLKILKGEFLQCQTENQKLTDEATVAGSTIKNLEEEVSNLKQERLELQEICQKIREHFQLDSEKSLSVLELGEKIDELVNKLSHLETSGLSQTAQITILRSKTDDLLKHLQSLEDEKLTLINDSENLNKKIRDLEEKLRGVQELNCCIEEQKNELQNNFFEACHNLDVLAEKLQASETQEAITTTNLLEAGYLLNVEPEEKTSDHEECDEATFTISESKKMSTDPNDDVQVLDLLEKSIDQEERVTSFESWEHEHSPDPEESIITVESQKQSKESEDEHSPDPEESVINVEMQKQSKEPEDLESLHLLLLDRLEDREKILLSEYTAILRNYKETKRRLSDVEKHNEETFQATIAQIRDLESSNAMKDGEIQSLRQKVNLLQSHSDEIPAQNELDQIVDRSQLPFYRLQAETNQPDPEVISKLPFFESFQDRNIDFTRRKFESHAGTIMPAPTAEEEIKVVLLDEANSVSKVEEEFRRQIDELLKENLEFWFRFSTSFHQIQKFQTTLQDLQEVILKLKTKNKKQEIYSSYQSVKSQASPIHKNLTDLQSKLSIWLEQNTSLKEELQCRISSLCSTQEEISTVLKTASENGEVRFTAYQAGKFQGKVLSTQQENNKVEDDLQAGLDNVRELQLEAEKTRKKLHENFKFSESKHHHDLRHRSNKTRITLRSSIFGTKQKKSSMFCCINPALRKKNSDLIDGVAI